MSPAMRRAGLLPALLLLAPAGALRGQDEPAAAAPPPAVAITDLGDRLRVEIRGRLFTEYRYRGLSRPILYPVHAPTGAVVVRHWPMRDDVAHEARDHVHQRSLWFAHGAVGGHDFWSEAAGAGRIEHEAFDEVAVEGGAGVVRARNRWLAADGELVCRETRVLRFAEHADGDGYLLDFDVTLRAGAGGLHLGDTKEGTMAIRLAPSLGLRGPAAAGHCVTSAGIRDQRAWGTRADWIDCFGPVDGEVVGVAIFDHPQNHAHPTWWHARDYGLIAANPFGVHDFEGKPPGAGDLRLSAGEELTLRYRFYLHRGDADRAEVAAAYAAYCREER